MFYNPYIVTLWRRVLFPSYLEHRLKECLNTIPIELLHCERDYLAEHWCSVMGTCLFFEYDCWAL